MPLGYFSAPATFDRQMESVLKGLTYEACIIYLDGIVVFRHTFEGQFDNLRYVFKRLRYAHLKLIPEKFQLFRKELRYLDHIVSPSRE